MELISLLRRLGSNGVESVIGRNTVPWLPTNFQPFLLTMDPQAVVWLSIAPLVPISAWSA